MNHFRNYHWAAESAAELIPVQNGARLPGSIQEVVIGVKIRVTEVIVEAAVKAVRALDFSAGDPPRLPDP